MNFFTVPKTCSEYKSIGVRTSGYYLIDPQQQRGMATQFNAFCDFHNGEFFIHFTQIKYSIL